MASRVAITNGKIKAFPAELTPRILYVCIFAALGGLMFGYDIGISGGVTSMPSFLEKFFPDVYHKEQSYVPDKDSYCKFSDTRLTLFISSFYLAGFVSSIMASYLTRIVGRKNTMLVGGFVFLYGAIVNRYAVGLITLVIGRLLLGFGVGFVNQSVPVYISEIAPSKYRGGFNMLFQFYITVGAICANLLSYLTSKSDEGWRTSLGCAIIPAVIFIMGVVFLPDTPNSMILRGKKDEALANLRWVRGVDDVAEEFDDLVAASVGKNDPWNEIMKMKYRSHLSMVTWIPIFQQLCGMNVFMFFAPVLFKVIGFGDDSSIMSTIILNMVICTATLVSIFSVDTFGRRALFIEGGIQMFISQIIITICIGLKFGQHGNPGPMSMTYAGMVVLAISVYVAGFGWSWGPLSWLVPSEILPLEIRSVGQSINVSLNMLLMFFISAFFLKGVCAMRLYLFIFCTIIVFVMTIFIVKLFPETKGIPIEKMNGIWKSHQYWKRFLPLEEDSGKVDIEMNVKNKDVPMETKGFQTEEMYGFRSSFLCWKKFMPSRETMKPIFENETFHSS